MRPEGKPPSLADDAEPAAVELKQVAFAALASHASRKYASIEFPLVAGAVRSRKSEVEVALRTISKGDGKGGGQSYGGGFDGDEIAKGGSKREINNWRPIAILRITYKIFARLLFQRLQPKLDKSQCSDQCGFRPGKFVDDAFIALEELCCKMG